MVFTNKLSVKVLEAKDEDGFFTLLIPNQLLYDWHSTRKDCCSNWEKMNSCIESHSFMVNDTAEERLRARAAKVFSKVEKAGSKRKIANMKDGSTTFQIYKGEVELSSNDSLTQQVKCLEDRVEQVTKDALKYKDQCKVMQKSQRYQLTRVGHLMRYMNANKKGKWLVLSMALSRLCHL